MLDMHIIERAEAIIRRHAAQLAEHPRCASVEVTRYPPAPRASPRPSIHLTAAFPDDGVAVEGIDHIRLAQRVAAETHLEVDPEYTGVFRWTRRNLIVYWWDWRMHG
ncbi:MAG TPA: hypothetical protein VHB98_12020 [Chloroflexota bacterium]|nr:hypothetical protein [Chloroflexota bacterium]